MTPSPSANDVKSWYNQHYAAKGLESMRPAAAYPVFLDLLDAQPGARLLDVSCGAGSLLAAAQERGVAAVGVDLSDQAVRLAKRVAPGAEVAVGAGGGLGLPHPNFGYGRRLRSPAPFLRIGPGAEEMQRRAQPGWRMRL